MTTVTDELQIAARSRFETWLLGALLARQWAPWTIWLTFAGVRGILKTPKIAWWCALGLLAACIVVIKFFGNTVRVL